MLQNLCFSSLRERVGSGRECVGLMVQSLLHEVEQHGADNQPDELLNLIKVQEFWWGGGGFCNDVVTGKNLWTVGASLQQG